MDDKNHWVSDLFPVKYSTNDFLFNNVDKDDDDYSDPGTIKRGCSAVNGNNRTKQREHDFTLANDFYSRIYSKVIAAEESENQLKDEQDSSGIFGNNIRTQAKNNDNNTFDIENNIIPMICDVDKMSRETKKTRKSGFWRSDDNISLLRDAYKKLKEKSLWLLCILESRNVKIDNLKVKNEDLVKKNKCLEKETSDLKRYILKLETQSHVYVKSNKDLENKLCFYEDCNNGLSESIQKLKNELNIVTKNFNKTVKDLNQSTLECRKMLLECKKQNNDQLAKLSKDYELQIDKLKKNIAQLEVKLFSKETECKTLSESLKYLDKHFLHNVVEPSRNRRSDHKNPNLEGNRIEYNFLDVTDI